MAYSVEIISMEQKEELADRYGGEVLYEIKSDIYGCCIKLLTGVASVKNAWEESFYSASQSIRSHGRLYVLQDKSLGENRVFYDPQSKTGFLFNMDYYGWIKSLALSVAGDILEDNHGIYSVHGACLDARRFAAFACSAAQVRARPRTPTGCCANPACVWFPMTGS